MRAAIGGTVLFFAAVATAEEVEVLLEKLRAENAQLRSELDQREAAIRSLTETLAIARTESELFQKKWAEAQLRAQTLGIDFGDTAVGQAHRQLLESVRALYLAEAERQRLAEQLQRLLQAVRGEGDLEQEIRRSRALLEAGAGYEAGQTRPAPRAEGSLEAAEVLEVNPDLRLAVLNVGLLQGARVGMPFVVLRGQRVVAELKVVEVRRRICGALIERIENGVTLAAGDAARVTKN
jgi:cell shape-determining protein MreC